MNKELHIVQHLYGEEADHVALHRLLEDPDLRTEYESLRAVKFHLDHRPRSKPDAEVLDTILAAANPAGVAPLGKRIDRSARPGRVVRRFRLFGAVSAVLAVVLVVGIGLMQTQTDTGMLDTAAPLASQPEAQASEQEEAAPPVAEEARSLIAVPEQSAPAPTPTPATGALAVSAVPPSPARERAAANRAADSETETVPAWDDSGALLRVHSRIEMLETRSSETAWDDVPVTSLDVLPAQNPAARRGLNAASQKKDH